jgi:UDP:flavonoid glycosyltransferase YjiC (YdhE family)
VTVGRATDVASLGPIPENTRVEQWIPQDAVLREAALVVCHGGSGTTFGALAAGIPLVVCPLFADQAQNGAAVRKAGAGVVIESSQPPAGGLRSLGPEDVGALHTAIEEVLNTPTYHRAATGIAAEIAAMPMLDELVNELV